MKLISLPSSLCTPKFLLPIFTSTSKSPPFIFAAAQPRKTATPRRSSESTKTTTPTPTLEPITTATTKPPVPNKKVLVPIGFGTEEMEAVIMVDVLRRAGAEVTLASVEPQLEVQTFGGTKLVADTLISACSGCVFDLIALPGGMPGSVRLRDCEVLKNIMSKHAEEKRLYGAICAAPAITLLPWGLLRRKQTTCHPAFMDKLSTFWAVKSTIKVSGELTTSRGPGTTFQFAICLVEQLFGEAVAKEIAELLLLNCDNEDPRKQEFNEVQWSLDHHTPQVLIPIANGSEEIEVVTVIDILRRARVNVVVASVEKSAVILASNGIKIVADKLIDSAAESTYDLIILPGGDVGVERLHKSRTLKKLLKEQQLAGRIFGAMCSSPTILQKQGLLKDKKSTAHRSVTSKLDDVIHSANVVVDGKLITSKGLSTATEFGLAIVSKFFGDSRAKSIAAAKLLNTINAIEQGSSKVTKKIDLTIQHQLKLRKPLQVLEAEVLSACNHIEQKNIAAARIFI